VNWRFKGGSNWRSFASWSRHNKCYSNYPRDLPDAV